MPVVILSAKCKYRELHHESLDKTLVVRIPELLSNVATNGTIFITKIQKRRFMVLGRPSLVIVSELSLFEISHQKILHFDTHTELSSCLLSK